MSLGMRAGGGSKAKNEPRAGQAGIHGNSESGNHPPDTVTLSKSVEILTNPKLTRSTNGGGREREKTVAQMHVSELKTNCTLTQLERTIRTIRETLYVTSRCLVHCLPLTSIGSTLT